MTPRLLARLLLGAMDAAFMTWYDRETQDIAAVADDVFAALHTVVCGGRRRND